MTSGGDIWDILGIAPTDDRRAIRSAYAVRLKAIDPEADPKAFIVLREALERAVAGAAAPDLPTIMADQSGEIEPDPTLSVVDLLDPASELERDTGTLFRMLNEHRNEGEDDAALVRCLDRILNSRAIVSGEAARQLEAWLASLVADRLPLSDPLIEPLIAHYRWDAYETEQRIDERLALILTRRRDLAFLSALTDPAHRFHHAFTMLEARPAEIDETERQRGFPALRKLLRIIHTEHPTLEWRYGDDHLKAWIDDIEAPRRPWYDPDREVVPAPVHAEPMVLPAVPSNAPRYTGSLALSGGAFAMMIAAFHLVRACSEMGS